MQCLDLKDIFSQLPQFRWPDLPTTVRRICNDFFWASVR